MTHIHHLTSLDDIRLLLLDLPTVCQQAQMQVDLRDPLLTKPRGSLGRLEELAHWAAGWQHSYPPSSKNFTCHIYAGNHGIADHGVSAFPQEATGILVRCFQSGQATINQLCRSFGIELQAHPLRLNQKTNDFTKGPALSEEAFLYAFNYGLNSISPDSNLVILGEMGIGNTSAASAIAHALFGEDAALWVGRGSGIDDETLTHKIHLIRAAVQKHQGNLKDPLEILRYFGGFELVAIAGAVIGARIKKVPVMLDGLICTAAAAPLAIQQAGALDHCQIAHTSVEPGHILIMERLGKKGLLDLDMRLGEASGGAIAANLVRAAIDCHNGLATLEEAGIRKPEAA